MLSGNGQLIWHEISEMSDLERKETKCYRFVVYHFSFVSQERWCKDLLIYYEGIQIFILK